jgi:hypothetical protein
MYPVGRFSKQVQFIQWIINVTGRIPPADFSDLLVPLFGLFRRLAASNSSKVVEASFKIWSDEKVIPMIIDSAQKIYPLMHDAIFRTMSEHWKPTTQQAASSAIQAMQDVDPFVFDALKLGQKRKKDLKTNSQSEDLNRLQKSWAVVVRGASRNDRKLLAARILVRVAQFFSSEVPTILPTSVVWYDPEERPEVTVERKY